MTTSERLATLEKKFAELQATVLGGRAPAAKDWRRTAGTFPRDKMTLKAEKLGREWRKQGK